MSGIWTGAILVILGWLLGFFTELLRHGMAKSDRRALAQREALIGLQESLLIVFRTAAKGYVDARRATRQAGTGQWIQVLPSPEENLQELEARGRAVMYRVRIEDDELGGLADAMIETMGRLLQAHTEAEAEGLMREVLGRHNLVSLRVGALLKTTY